MPNGMPTNINWITLVGALIGLFSWLCPDIPPAVRMDILVVAFVCVLAVISAVHTFWNHRDVHPSLNAQAQAGAHSDLPTYQPNATATKEP